MSRSTKLTEKWDKNLQKQRKSPRSLRNIYSTEIITSSERATMKLTGGQCIGESY